MASTAGEGGGIGGACPTGPSTASNTNGAAPGRGAATAATDAATDGKKKKGGAESVSRLCANPDCRQPDAKKLCASCKRVSYCSRRCQKIHWGMGGHKKFCALMAVPRTNPGSALVSTTITSSSTPSSSQPTGPAAAYGSYPTTDVGDAVNP